MDVIEWVEYLNFNLIFRVRVVKNYELKDFFVLIVLMHMNLELVKINEFIMLDH